MNRSSLREKFRNMLVSFSVITMLCLVIWTLFQGGITSLISAAKGEPSVRYYLAAVNADGYSCAIGVDAEMEEALTYHDEDGKKRTVSLTDIGMTDSFDPMDIYLSTSGDLLIGGRDGGFIQIYLLEYGTDTVKMLYSFNSGMNYSDAVTHFCEDSSGYSFMVEDGDTATVYVYDIQNSSFQSTAVYDQNGYVPLAVLADGTEIVKEGTDTGESSAKIITVSLTDDDTLTVSDAVEGGKDAANDPAVQAYKDANKEEKEASTRSRSGGNPAKEDAKADPVANNSGSALTFKYDTRDEVWYVMGTIWILDNTNGDIWCTSSRGTTALIESLESEEDEENILSVTVSDAGLTSVSDDYAIKLCRNPKNTQDLSSQFLSSRPQAIIALLLMGFLAIAMIPILYTVLEINRMNGQSFVLREGLAILSITITIIAASDMFIARPHCSDIAREWLWNQLKEVCAEDLQLHIDNNSNFTFIHQDANTNENVLNGLSIMHYIQTDGQMYVIGDDGTVTHISVTRRPGTYIETIEAAFEEGNASSAYYYHGKLRYMYAERDGNVVTGVACLNSSVELIEEVYDYHSRTIFLLMLAALSIPVLISLWVIRGRIRSLTTACNALSQGRLDKLYSDSSDEIGTLSLGIQNAVLSIKSSNEKTEHLRTEYNSFMPEAIVKLLGAEDVESIRSGQYVRQTMDMFSVVLAFPDKESGEPYPILFEDRASILGRISKYIDNFGGIVVDYQDNSIDAVFPAADGSAVQAAVAVKRDINIINGSVDAGSRHYTVRAFVILDEKEVEVGIVGTDQCRQYIFSPRIIENEKAFSTALMKIEDCVICTDRILEKSKGWNNRFIGEVKKGSGKIRLFEIFDGDESNIKEAKEHTKEVFESGIERMLAGSFDEAEDCFMDVIRINHSDEIAKYFLEVCSHGGKNPEKPEYSLK